MPHHKWYRRMDRTGTIRCVARLAYRRFGKGTGHPARLNVGDCFSNALAVERGTALLYKGSDFAHTDIASAL